MNKKRPFRRVQMAHKPKFQQRRTAEIKNFLWSPFSSMDLTTLFRFLIFWPIKSCLGYYIISMAAEDMTIYKIKLICETEYFIHEIKLRCWANDSEAASDVVYCPCFWTCMWKDWNYLHLIIAVNHLLLFFVHFLLLSERSANTCLFCVH